MTRFASPCFSGECGLCPECCGSDYIHDIPNEISRAKDMNLLYGRKRVDEISTDYSKRLSQWCSERGYRNPSDSGWTKKTVKKCKPGSLDPMRFELLTTSHPDKICSDTHCTLLYEDSNEWLRNKSFPITPLYSWRDGERTPIKYICGVCLDHKSEF